MSCFHTAGALREYNALPYPAAASRCRPAQATGQTTLTTLKKVSFAVSDQKVPFSNLHLHRADGEKAGQVGHPTVVGSSSTRRLPMLAFLKPARWRARPQSTIVDSFALVVVVIDGARRGFSNGTVSPALGPNHQVFSMRLTTPVASPTRTSHCIAGRHWQQSGKRQAWRMHAQMSKLSPAIGRFSSHMARLAGDRVPEDGRAGGGETASAGVFRQHSTPVPGRTRVDDDGRGSAHGPISLGLSPRCDGLIYRIAVSVDSD